MAKAKQVFETAAWFCDGLPAGDLYSRETAEADCRAGMGRASKEHHVLFGPLRWSELKAGDARAPAPPTDAPGGGKWLHVEGSVTGLWKGPWGVKRAKQIEPVSSSSRVTAGVHGDFARYRYNRDDSQLWHTALAALGGETWRDRRRQYRALREQIDWYASWRALWDASPRAGPVRDQLTAVIMAGDSFYAALAACGGTAMALLSRQAGQRPVECLMMEFAEMRAAAARALASLPEDKGGPSPNLPLHQLLRSLDELWRAERKAPPLRPKSVAGEDPE
ncbi:MAG: hypothetical protein O6831_10940, partial [Alphaproteobacteria bacterium]|nr:hypothetical protein [Alphaproteobacteria bacterium]